MEELSVIRLQGDEKEKYIDNLILATSTLINGIKKDDTLKISEWDIEVYTEIIRILEFILSNFKYLRNTTNQGEDNFGIYKELILSNGGLPEFFSYHQLLDDKIHADLRIKEILDSENISSKEELIKKWIDIANNPNNIENKKHYLLDVIPNKFQSLEFYNELKIAEIFDIKNPMEKLFIRPLKDIDQKERYLLSWFNYVSGFGVFNIYVAMIEEIDPKGLSKIYKNIPKKGYLHQEDNGINIEPIFRKFLEDHISSGAFFMAREMDKTFQTIFPERISMFQFGPNYVKGIKSDNLNFSMLFIENEDAYFLTAIREDIKRFGEKEKNKKDILDQIAGTKCIWKGDMLVEQKFGICSRGLEKQLKSLNLCNNMNFYII